MQWYLLLIYLYPCLLETSGDPVPIMIADLLKSMERPSAIVATVCWPAYKKLSLHNNVPEDNRGGSSVTMMQFLKPGEVPERHTPDQHIVFLADLGCEDIGAYFNQSSAAKHFCSPFRWILLNDDESASIIPDSIADLEVLPDAEVIVANRSGTDSYQFYSIYRISALSPWITVHYGSWNPARGFRRSEEKLESPIMRRMNLKQFPISICYVLTDEDSYNHLDDGRNDHIDTITKVNFPSTNHLLDFLNASKRSVFANTWGYKVNGTWNGLTGYLVRDEVEIGGSPMFFTFERISVVDYISSPTPTRSKFVFQQPKLSYENNLFLLSFRTTVWYSSLALVFLMFLALLAVAAWEWNNNKSLKRDCDQTSGILRGNVQDVALLVFGAACQQGSPVELKGSLGRIVMLILFLALMFLYTSYSANIVALLQSSSSKIRNLEDLLHSRLKFGVHDTVFNRYYFSTATEPVRKAIYQSKIAPSGVNPRFISMEEGIRKMRKGLFAFHMETGVGYKFVGKYFHEGEKCGLMEIQYLQVIDPWLAVRKNTPYKEMFKIGLKRIQECGLQKRENQRFYEPRPKCASRGSSFVSVSMVDCYPALLVLSYGTIVSVFLLALEVLSKKRQALIERCRRMSVDSG